MEQTRQLLTDHILANQGEFYRLAYSYVKNREAALDVVQESIVRALTKIDTLREPAYLKTWFYRILVNESLTHYRRGRRLVSLEEAGPEEVREPPDHAARLDLYDAIAQLSAVEQTVIRLRFFQDLKLEEISRVTGANLNTVKTRLYKALSKLRDLTGEDVTDGF